MAKRRGDAQSGREKSSLLGAAHPRAALGRCTPERAPPARAGGGGHPLTAGAAQGRRLAQAAWGADGAEERSGVPWLPGTRRERGLSL